MLQRTLLLATLLFTSVHATQALAADVTADVIYGHKDGMTLFYDVLHPDAPNGAGVVFMVSGGWFSVWQPPSERGERFEGLLAAGFTVYLVHHGSAPRYRVPDAVSDVRAALRHIKANADAMGVDAQRLGVWGGSAGGHLTLLLALSPEVKPDAPPRGRARALGPHYVNPTGDARVAAAVAFYPPVDLRPLVGPVERFPALDFDPARAADVSPILHVSDDDPPVLLVHGDADTLVPLRNSESLAAAFEAAGVEHDFITIEGGDHGFRNDTHRREARDAMVAWFVAHLTEP